MWEDAHDYKAIIGGCYFQDVPSIIELNKSSVIGIKRNVNDRKLGIYVDVNDQNSNRIAKVRANKITLTDGSNYKVIESENRQSIIGRNGSIIYDLNFFQLNINKKLDFELSVITYLQNGIPLILHPNRIKIGFTNNFKPQIKSLRFETTKGYKGSAINLNFPAGYNHRGVINVQNISMVGGNGCVNNSINDKKEFSALMMLGINNQVAGMIINGPCYFIDSAFTQFDSAINITI